ncbi:hypothetical protein PROFUN_13922 [Planoprotostelium fungivorum]|uniref:ATP-dependent RNA helicase n=1 Tax=Planoprotostelium fungivorum TaxID=1890364 RepID=A0A2P6N2E4_9EUKA|nr:hypothetical protein PROFUN_13922 [Planoprotostelium fungivorum]
MSGRGQPAQSGYKRPYRGGFGRGYATNRAQPEVDDSKEVLKLCQDNHLRPNYPLKVEPSLKRAVTAAPAPQRSYHTTQPRMNLGNDKKTERVQGDLRRHLVTPIPNISTEIKKTTPSNGKEEAFSSPEFSDMEGKIDSKVLKAVAQDLKYDLMTPIQSRTVLEALSGKDCLAQAKTGTGKTIAFLIPAIQNIIKRGPVPGISTLIISPTRELAMQIGKEAEMLVKYLGLKVNWVIGGTNINSEKNKLMSKCDILVATPGRLIDHMNDPEFNKKLLYLNTYILDEADRLLDQGFAPAIDKIHSNLPDRRRYVRQNLLFSATIPPGVNKIARDLLDSSNFVHFSTIPPDDVETHKKVNQYCITSSIHDQHAMLQSLIATEHAHSTPEDPFKAVVFFTTARGSGFAFDAFSNLKVKPFNTLKKVEIHSRMSQTARVRAADNFKTMKEGILFTSDVSARGMDYPKVTHVFQLGAPADVEQYIHRIGRTGRAGNDGDGFILLDPLEMNFMDKLKTKDLPFKSYERMQEAEGGLKEAKVSFNKAAAEIPQQARTSAYTAWLGEKKTSLGKKLGLRGLVELSFKYSNSTLQFPTPPAVRADFIGKAGLKECRDMFTIDKTPKPSHR